MGNLLVDERDQLFILHEMLGIEKLCDSPLFAEHSREVFDMVLNEAHKFAASELMPTNAIADQESAIYDSDTQSVKAPECYHHAYKLFREGSWIAMCDSPEVGGQGFPLTLGTAVSEIFYAGSFCLYGAAELTHGAAKLIEVFGTDEQKERFMRKLYSAEWMGTMDLTESNAGSDLGAIKTKAVKIADGSYSISGTKIFVSAGEHDLTENIIHMILARVEGDPLGTKGLSLFIVPKFLVNDDGSLGERNDITCSGIERKMGIHALSTNTLNFGDNGKCIGYLLGGQGKGMRTIFHMMNEQRLLVGLEGLSQSSTAFLNAVDYTKNRIQGTSVYKKSDSSVPIIQHPDVKRMLLWMKVYVEGCRAITYFVSYCIDQTHVTEGEERDKWQGIVDLLIPVVKAYDSDKSWEVTGTAIQCAAGYGYCSDYPFERFARDCKIASIFEGTNGIQAIDLMFRKLIGNKLVSFNNLILRIDNTIAESRKVEPIREYVDIFEKAKEGLVEIVDNLMAIMNDGREIDLYAKATPFLEVMGDVVLGWMHLWQLSISYPKLIDLIGNAEEEEIERILDENNEAAFYYGKVLGAKFYIGSILKRTFGKFEQLRSEVDSVIKIPEKSFTY
jgi:alkylation response protein AidB-like acyl-CoA dehydrogenase